MQAVYGLIGTRYRLYAILQGPDTGCIRPRSDPMQPVYAPIKNPIQTVYGPMGMRYGLYTILLGSDTDCIRSYRDPIQAVRDPIGTRYRLYTIP